jgi:hypothetical protein
MKIRRQIQAVGAGTAHIFKSPMKSHFHPVPAPPMPNDKCCADSAAKIDIN